MMRVAKHHVYHAAQLMGGLLGLAVLLTACASPAPDPTPTLAVMPSATPDLPTPEVPAAAPTQPPTAIPTEVPRDFRAYRHATGVFNIAIPADWEALDASTDQRLLVRYIPPPGYGSRVTVDVTNEGPLPPGDIEALAESYIHLHYGSDDYTEIYRSGPEGDSLEFVFMYNDGRGAAGRETVTIRQYGPYFAALRVFLAEKDQLYLSQAIESIVASFTVDALAGWGSSVAAINPAELLVVNDVLWRDDNDVTHYTGEIYNASPADVTEASLKLALCAESGVVLVEETQPTDLAIIPSGAAAPVAFAIDNMPESVTVCSKQVSAIPARPDPRYTTALALEASAGRDAERNVVVRGTVTNPSLSAVGNVDVLLMVYDSEGRLIGYQAITFGAGTVFEAGEGQSFTHTFETIGGEVARFVTVAQGENLVSHNPSLAPADTGE